MATGRNPLQAGFFHLVPQLRTVFAGGPIPQGRDSYAPASASARRTSKRPPVFPQEKENSSLSFFPRASRAPFLLCCSARELLTRATRDPSAAGLPPAVHVAFCGHPINKKCGPAALRREPAQKSVDFSLKKTHVGTPGLHALASAARTYSLTARIHYCPFSFLLFYKGKEKRKQKQIQQVRIHRSDSLRSSSRCTRLARRASSAEIYVAIATRFVRDCVEDLALLAASMERISKCSLHIKDHYPGVIKASRISFLPLRLLSPLKFFPKKI